MSTPCASELSHPAPFSAAVLAEIGAVLDLYLPGPRKVLDPFAGIGRVHSLDADTHGVEIEPEWAEIASRSGPTLCQDSRHPLPFEPGGFDAIATSPTYGNRMADHHHAQDGSYRRTYRHLLGRPLNAGNAGGMQWGDDYRRLHREVYANVSPLVRAGGFFLLNVKNHVRAGVEIEVVGFHIETLIGLGWVLRERRLIATLGFRYGANRDRYPEQLFVMEKT